MEYFRAGVASHSNRWLSAVGPFATAPKSNTPATLFVSVLSLAFLTKQDLATAQCESRRARARRLSTPVDTLRVPEWDPLITNSRENLWPRIYLYTVVTITV
jgi:hypothetical protein